MKNTNDDDNFKKDTFKNQDGNKGADNPDTFDTSCNESVINTTK